MVFFPTALGFCRHNLELSRGRVNLLLAQERASLAGCLATTIMVTATQLAIWRCMSAAIINSQRSRPAPVDHSDCMSTWMHVLTWCMCAGGQRQILPAGCHPGRDVSAAGCRQSLRERRVHISGTAVMLTCCVVGVFVMHIRHVRERLIRMLTLHMLTRIWTHKRW
eukprot:1154939-Pelagomonas_calceolata.AAC.14